MQKIRRGRDLSGDRGPKRGEKAVSDTSLEKGGSERLRKKETLREELAKDKKKSLVPLGGTAHK